MKTKLGLLNERYRLRLINKLVRKYNLPPWWVQSVIVEYFPCRRFLENESLWTFDFKLINDKLIETLPIKHVVIPEYYIVQNIRPEDFRQRLLLTAFGSNPVAEMDEKDIYPDGVLNESCFPVLGNSIDVWDPKLGFHIHAVILAACCLESYINMIIQKYPNTPHTSKRGTRERWKVVGNFLNNREQFIDDCYGCRWYSNYLRLSSSILLST
jgi:hypothetical protein